VRYLSDDIVVTTTASPCSPAASPTPQTRLRLRTNKRATTQQTPSTHYMMRSTHREIRVTGPCRQCKRDNPFHWTRAFLAAGHPSTALRSMDPTYRAPPLLVVRNVRIGAFVGRRVGYMRCTPSALPEPMFRILSQRAPAWGRAE
jgi:hypothetical protein